jgi:membrane protein DedA with SNARE-associated domain
MHPALAWLAVVMGATAGSVLNYHIGQLMGHTRWSRASRQSMP